MNGLLSILYFSFSISKVAQKSHLLPTFLFLRSGLIAPKGHTIMHIQQPTHLSSSCRTMPALKSKRCIPLFFDNKRRKRRPAGGLERLNNILRRRVRRSAMYLTKPATQAVFLTYYYLFHIFLADVNNSP